MENKDQEELQKAKTKEEKLKRKNKILILLLLLLLLFGGWFIYKEYGDEMGLPRQKNTEKGFLPGMTEAEIQAEMEKRVSESELAISINSKLYFPSGSEAGDIRIENSTINHYLLMVEMYLVETNEMIYQSGAIDPGYYLEKDKLNKNLEKGTYPVNVKFKAYDINTEAFIGEAQANTEIVIEK